MMKEICVRADKYVISFATNCPESIKSIQIDIEDFVKHSINFAILEIKSNMDALIIYIDTDEYDLYLDKTKKELYFKCPWDKISKSTIFQMIFKFLLEWLRQINNEIRMHASSIFKDNKTVLFMGPSEGGKSTTAMAMCQNFGYSLRSNDAAVLQFQNNIPYMLRGDPIIGVRHSGLKAYSKDIYKKKVENDRTSPWDRKMKILPNEIGISVNEDITEITNLFFIKLDVMVDDCLVKKYSDVEDDTDLLWFKHKMHILQNTGGTIRGSDFVPMGSDGKLLPLVIPSLDDDNLYLNRMDGINKLFKSCTIYQLRGQLDDMLTSINQILNF